VNLKVVEDVRVILNCLSCSRMSLKMTSFWVQAAQNKVGLP
jgi:hypothetical protein